MEFKCVIEMGKEVMIQFLVSLIATHNRTEELLQIWQRYKVLTCMQIDVFCSSLMPDDTAITNTVETRYDKGME